MKEQKGKKQLEETERLKAFRKRKAKELRRRRRWKIIGRLLVILILIAVIGVAINFVLQKMDVDLNKIDLIKEIKGRFQAEQEQESATEEISVSLTESAEETAIEATTEEPTTEEPTTEARDPREDVWDHYQNLFIVSETQNYLNVRDQPSMDGNIIGKLVKYAGGEISEVLDNGWYHISSGGIDGYIAQEFCSTGEAAKLLAIDHCYEMVEVTAERLNVRTGPGEEYEVWTQLSATEKQVVEEEEGDWLRITINSSSGYISKEFTKKGFYLVEAMPWSSISNCSEQRQALFAYAEQFLGTPYVYGGTSLTGGIDCSSYVQQCYLTALGIQLERTTKEQVNQGIPISLEDAKPGDLLFYADPQGVINHVAFYLGDGKILHAAQSFGQVIISKYNYSTEPVAVRNMIGD